MVNLKEAHGITDENIQVATTLCEEGGEVYEVHYYHRFIRPKTEMWMFGAGLGDLTLIRQLGDSFFEYVDQHGDPELGRLMFSMGCNATARMPYKGALNIWWPWGVNSETFLKNYYSMSVQPDLIITPWTYLQEQCEEHGIPCAEISVGVGRRFFKPLNGLRRGLGFAGLDNKSKEQKHIVLGPAMKRSDFEWISKSPDSKFLTIPELNEWYNTKRILFGMVAEDRHDIGYMPTRVLETLASGTPLITYRLDKIQEVLGIQYPYQTTSYEQTEFHIRQIMSCYDKVTLKLHKISKHIRENHNYVKRLEYLFPILRAML